LKNSAASDVNPGKLGKVARGRLHPPPEEDLGGGDICSLEEKPSTEDNMPLVAHATTDPAKEAELEDYDFEAITRSCSYRADGCRLRCAIAVGRRSRPVEPASP
jgi:hypothetical protein